MLASIRRWWPVPLLLAGVLVAQSHWLSRQDVRGHATGHVTSASAVFGTVFLVGTLLLALEPDVRWRVTTWVLAIGLVAANWFVAVGNLRVVDAIGGDDWSDDMAARLGPDRPGFESGHVLADRASLAAVLLTVAMVCWLWARVPLQRGVAVAAIVLSVVVPRWIFPGAGLAVLVVAMTVRKERSARRAVAGAAV